MVVIWTWWLLFPETSFLHSSAVCRLNISTIGCPLNIVLTSLWTRLHVEHRLILDHKLQCVCRAEVKQTLPNGSCSKLESTCSVSGLAALPGFSNFFWKQSEIQALSWALLIFKTPYQQSSLSEVGQFGYSDSSCGTSSLLICPLIVLWLTARQLGYKSQPHHILAVWPWQVIWHLCALVSSSMKWRW